MIEGVKIENLRGIENCEISDISLINIFAGKNNSGKSTILDAIYLACKEPLGYALREILNKRASRRVGGSELFFAYDPDRKVSIKSTLKSGRVITLDFFINKKAANMGNLGTVQRGYIVSQLGGIAFGSYQPSDLTPSSFYGLALGETFHDAALSEAFREYSESMQIFLSSIKVDELTTELDRRLAAIKRDRNLEAEFKKHIADIYGEFAYEYVPMAEDKEDRRAAFEQGHLRVYSEFHGSGLQRATLLIAALLLSKNTAFLIEEVELFQHPNAIKKLAKHIVQLARQNDIQLFITSHSYYDALRFFYYAYTDDEQRKREFRSFVVEKTNGKVAVTKADVPDIIKELYGDQ